MCEYHAKQNTMRAEPEISVAMIFLFKLGDICI